MYRTTTTSLLTVGCSFRRSGHRCDCRDGRCRRQHAWCWTTSSRHLDKRDDSTGSVSDEGGRHHLSVGQHDVKAAQVVVLAFVRLEGVVDVLLLLLRIVVLLLLLLLLLLVK